MQSFIVKVFSNLLEHFRGASGHRFALRKCDKTKDWRFFPIRSDRKKL